ncbi:RNA polymerase sigma factor [Aquisphaera insulae]|uniref:RNA polymerase sigma factor n=1 Tax=Aquisphaera insulae TaxID=2712864 RepID=UPI0013ED421C|nr:sigma-70 family RNA polymerase sigma factor [Aquisphaera insulae]
MSGGEPSGALRDGRALFRSGMLGGLTDGELLRRFAGRVDGSAEDAFAILMERHGPMVWGVCRRALPDRNDAADAFQATFLVLARRASAVRVDDSLGPWLHGVCRRVAARARATSLRRRARESGEVDAVTGPVPDPADAERLAILDEEIGRLPERQRAAVVLCDLEGLPHEEAARRLGCPVGTVESRLSRGRRLLRDRLVRRGLAPAAAALGAGWVREASAAIPSALLTHPSLFVTSSPAAGGVSAAATTLAEGAIRMIWLSRLKLPAAFALALLLATVGVAVHGRQQPAAPAGRQDQAKAALSPPPTVASAPDLNANRALARKQLALIDETLAMLHQLARNARISPSAAPFSVWERRKLDTLRRAGASKPEMVAELEKLIKSLKEQEAIAVAMHQGARATEVDVNDVRFRIMEAETLLNEEKAR